MKGGRLQNQFPNTSGLVEKLGQQQLFGQIASFLKYSGGDDLLGGVSTVNTRVEIRRTTHGELLPSKLSTLAHVFSKTYGGLRRLHG